MKRIVKFPFKCAASVVLFGAAMTALSVITVAVALYSTIEKIEGGGD